MCCDVATFSLVVLEITHESSHLRCSVNKCLKNLRENMNSFLKTSSFLTRLQFCNLHPNQNMNFSARIFQNFLINKAIPIFRSTSKGALLNTAAHLQRSASKHSGTTTRRILYLKSRMQFFNILDEINASTLPFLAWN